MIFRLFVPASIMKSEVKMKEHKKQKGIAYEPFLSRHSLYCLALSWMSAALILNLVNSFSFISRDYYRYLSFPACLLFVTAFWFLLRTFRSRTFLVVLMFLVCSVYCLRTIMQQDDIFYTLGCCALMAVIIWFSPTEEIKLEISGKKLWLLAGIGIALFTVWIGGICAAIYLNYGAPTYDFGIFAQMFYYMKKTGLPYTTCERDGLLSHFAVHLSPVYYLLLPLYLLFPDPATLEVGQCLVIASGVIPLILLARRFRLSKTASAVFAGIYLSYPAFVGGSFFHIHENHFLTAFLLWMFLAFEAGKTLPMAVTTLLVLSVKEDAAVYAVILILYFLIRDLREAAEKKQEPDDSRPLQSRKKAAAQWILLALSVLYFVLAVRWLSSSGDGAMTGRYGNYMYDGGSSLLTVIKAVLINPMYAAAQCFTDEKIFSSILILLPLGGMAVWMSSWEELLLLVPYLLFNMMSDYYYQHILGYQYYYGSGAFLFFLSVLHYSKWKGAVRRKILAFGLAASCLICVSMYHGRLFDYLPSFWKNPSSRQEITELLSSIPDDASVKCSTFLLAGLSERDEIYDIDYTLRECDYLALDLRYLSGREAFEEAMEDPRYELIAKKDHLAAVFKRWRGSGTGEK